MDRHTFALFLLELLVFYDEFSEGVFSDFFFEAFMIQIWSCWLEIGAKPTFRETKSEIWDTNHGDMVILP